MRRQSTPQMSTLQQPISAPWYVFFRRGLITDLSNPQTVLFFISPTVLQKGRIRLKLHISQNVPGQVLQQADGEVLAIDKQEIETQVEVKSGETLALGGIFTRKNKSGQDSVPLLGDIPCGNRSLYPGIKWCRSLFDKYQTGILIMLIFLRRFPPLMHG